MQDLNRLLCLEAGASSAGLRESTPQLCNCSVQTFPHTPLLSAQLNLSVAMDCLSAAISYLEVSPQCVCLLLCV